MKTAEAYTLTLVMFLVGVLVGWAVPSVLFAQTGQIGGEEHPRCIQWVEDVQRARAQNRTPPPPYSCQEAGISQGICTPSKLCRGLTAADREGEQQGLDTGMKMLQQLLQQVLGKLGQGGGGGGGGQPPQPPPQQPPQTPGGGTSTSSFLNPSRTQAGGESGGLVNNLLDNIRNNDTSGSSFGDAFGDDEDTQTGTTTQGADEDDDVDQGLLDIIRGEGRDSADDGEGGQGENTTEETTTQTGTGTGAIDTDDTTSSDDIASERSEVRTRGSDTTLVAGVRDPDENTGISGFFGVSERVSSVSQGVIGRVCETRPWGAGFISQFLPTSFFDGLCERGGYAVGDEQSETEESDASAPVDATQAERAAQERAQRIREGEAQTDGRGITCEPPVIQEGGTVDLSFSCAPATLTGTAGFEVANADVNTAEVSPASDTTYGILCSDDFESACSVSVVDPQVTIWSEPEAVRLGGRATIYWNTNDVESCDISGPNLTESGTYGGAPTASITEASTYTISCDTPDGAEITEQVTVELSL